MKYRTPCIEVIEVRDQEVFLEDSQGVGVGGNPGGPEGLSLLGDEPAL